MSEQSPTGKGRPTPSRKEAEAARKQAMKQPTSRKEQARRDRAAREELRRQQMKAMRGEGDPSMLPARDRGPVRRFVRDFVDRRRNVSEYLLPIVILVFVLTVAGSPTIVAVGSAVWFAIIIGSALDTLLLVRGLRKELRARFPDTPTPGTTFYAILRSTQIRRFRMPRPEVDRGQELPARY